MIAALALAAVAGPSGWVLTDRLEQDNAFCVSCHLDAERTLHADNRRDFDARPPEALAPAHAAAGHPDERPFRCIDCHGGTGFLGRGRVKLHSAKDAFWYVVGRFEEPEGMHWPIEDEDCVSCHDAFDPPVREAWQAPAFHALAVHNTAFDVSCVSCHIAHERGGLTGSHFLHPAIVRAGCATCHSEFEKELEQ
ncbi:MAG: hypothetical protein GY937_18870 [bacterium]|nr:hypothetical protein [bacterium]